jgi:hypothetical protein
MTMRIRRQWILSALCIALTACAPEELVPEGDLVELDEEVVGFTNYGNPEIGLLADSASVNRVGRFCTATAVAPNVLVTARHCLWFARHFFTIEEPFVVRRFDVRETWAHPHHDIGLVWVRQGVPFTRPLKETGTVNATAAVWGFGGNNCDLNPVTGDWAYNDGYGVKRVGFFTTQANGNINAPIICPGDSGGPVVDWSDGKIFGVVSTSSGSQPGDRGTFVATNRPGVWSSLLFMIYIWQSESNAGR